MANSLFIRLILGLVSFSLLACGATNRPKPNDPYYAPTASAMAPVAPRTEGSLFQSSYGLNLFDDRKALRIGDIITVTLSERTVSRKTSGVSVAKESKNNMGVGKLLGTNLPDLETSLAQKRDFSGDAGADQSNSLQGNITVTVADVLPNGNLVVRGEKWMTLNRGDEFIRISGIVRPDDISPDNTVISTRLANAKISYSGTGALADSQSMGWLTRFFNSDLWPF